MRATSGRLTADDLFRLPDDGYRYELVNGELRQMTPSGFEHGAVVASLTAPLALHVKARRLGVVCGAETGFLISRDPDTVLAPDVAFVRRERIPTSGRPATFWAGPPDLAVEVLSPGDTVFAVEEKVAAWLRAGTLVVWVVNPKSRTVTIHRADSPARTLREDDTLEDEDLVAGLRLPIADIFAP